MKILFIRPPRYMWPMNSESSSFWQPLGFANMAAVLRENNLKVDILDCLPLKIGWKSLRKEIRVRNPDIVCVGDETASFHESVRVINLVKELNKETICVAGGYYFGNMVEESLNNTNVDFIVKGEGEITLLELVKVLSKDADRKKLEKVEGIAYRTKKGIMINKDRALIKDLDSLPFPAYDLLPMHLYGKHSKNHHDFVALEHGRGCSGGCNFCSIWQQMSNKGKVCYRTKSAKRCFEETKYFVEKYKRKTINWVDGTFNLDSKWNKEYFELLEKNGIKINHTAWIRADCVVRDEKSGIMKKMVDNGLVQAFIGMERFDKKSMATLNKKNNSPSVNRTAFKILREKYPSIYTVATLIYGMPNDRWGDLFKINKIIHSDFADMIFMLPFTPYPGTKLWDEYKHKLQNVDLRKYNLHLPIMGTKYISRKMLNLWFKFSLIDYVLFRPGNAIKRTIGERNKRKRRVQRSLAGKIFKLGTQHLWNKLTFKKGYELDYGIKPDWYDS